MLLSQANLRALAAAVGATGGLLNGAVMRLFANNVVVSPNTVLADLTEATFVGYAASAAIVWGSPYNDVGGNASIEGGATQFTATASSTPNVIYGWYLTNSAGSTLLAVENLPNPIPIANVGDAVIVVPIYSQGQPPTPGAPNT